MVSSETDQFSSSGLGSNGGLIASSSMDADSCYYLDHSDGPDLILVSQLLTGDKITTLRGVDRC